MREPKEKPIKMTGQSKRITKRKQAQQKLQESEEKYRTLVEQAKDGIVILQDGKIKFVNPYLADLLGYTIEELMDSLLTDHISPDELPKAADLYRRRMNGEKVPHVYESTILHKDGSRVEVEFNAGMTNYGGKRADLVIVRDITEQKQLQDERDRILDFSQDLICIARMDGYFKYVNPAWEKILGYTNEELLSKPFLDFIHPDDHAKNDAEVEKLATGQKTLDFENRYLHKDGVVRHISWVATPLQEEGLLYCIGRDITKRKQIEEKLSEREEDFRALYKNALVALFRVALKDGKPIVANKRAAELFGYKTIEEFKEEFRSLKHNANPEDREPIIQELKEKGYIDRIVMRSRKKDGTLIWNEASFRMNPEQGYVDCVSIDITERKRAEEELWQSEEKFKALFENSPDLVALTDLKGTFLDINRVAPGYKKEMVIGTGVTDYLTPQQKNEFNAVVAKAIKTGESQSYEPVITTPEGIDIHWHNRVSPLKKGDKVDRLIINFTDITERKQAEERIREYAEQLKALALQLTLTEEKERRHIAADLHDQLGHSLALARMQLDAVLKAASQTERTLLINDISNILLEAIHDTKNIIFELSSPLMNEIGLAAAISEWLEEYLERRYGLETELIDKSSDISLDSDLRAILFRNVRELFTNIIKHAKAKKMSVVLEKSAEEYVISITDDGIGFDPEEISREVKQERGFGLFSIQERLSDLGGSLKILSKPGQGTKVIMSIPFKNNVKEKT